VDIGDVIRPADVVPVVIKSLIFPGAGAAAKAAVVAYAPTQTKGTNKP
jgi:hypothetical protein